MTCPIYGKDERRYDLLERVGGRTERVILHEAFGHGIEGMYDVIISRKVFVTNIRGLVLGWTMLDRSRFFRELKVNT